MRELHDVVSHSLGVMLVQAEAADAIAEPGDTRASASGSGASAAAGTTRLGNA